MLVEAYLSRPAEGMLGADMVAGLATKLDAIVAQMTQDELKDYFVGNMLKDFSSCCTGLLKLEKLMAGNMPKE